MNINNIPALDPMDSMKGEERYRMSRAMREASLTPRESQVVQQVLYYGKTQTEIAATLGIDQSRVSRIQCAAISKLTNWRLSKKK